MLSRLATGEEIDALMLAPDLTLFQLDFLRRKGRFDTLELDQKMSLKTIEEILEIVKFGSTARRMEELEKFAGRTGPEMTFKDYLSLLRYKNRFDFVLAPSFRMYFDEARDSETSAIEKEVQITKEKIDMANRRLNTLKYVYLDEDHEYLKKNVTGRAQGLANEIKSNRAVDAWNEFLQAKNQVDEYQAFGFWTEEEQKLYTTAQREFDYEMIRERRMMREADSVLSQIDRLEAAASKAKENMKESGKKHPQYRRESKKKTDKFFKF